MLIVDQPLIPSLGSLLYPDDYANWLYFTLHDNYCSITLPQYFQAALQVLEQKQYPTCIIDFSFGPQALQVDTALQFIEAYFLPDLAATKVEYLILLSAFGRIKESQQKLTIDLWEKEKVKIAVFDNIIPAIRWLGKGQRLRQKING
jgi:hypothetical protein